MRDYPLIRCLVIILKQFLIYHNLLESFNGGISSYCLILLILSYLQVGGSHVSPVIITPNPNPNPNPAHSQLPAGRRLTCDHNT